MSLNTRALKWIVPAALMLPALILCATFLREFLAADACLDRGGSFDYARMSCDYETGHDYVAFSDRHGTLTAIGAPAFLAAVIWIMWGAAGRPGAGR